MSAAVPLTILARFIHLARDIKLSHSIFALPFALLATFLASGHAAKPGQTRLPAPETIALIILCMVLARTVAMAFNRWADAKLDAENPRTLGRAIPSGRVTGTFMFSVATACAFGFIIACAGFWLIDGNAWPLLLSPVVLAWLGGYSYTKRFTWFCHLYLGTALALSPVAATLAVEPGFLSRGEPWLLAGMVMCWVAGFDIIYALQDVDADRAAGTHSMPANLGVEPALWISRMMHLASLGLLIALATVCPMLAVRFDIGIAIVAGLLVLEHALVWRSKTHHIHMAFFTLNGLISVLLGTLGIWDVMTA
jgi:4-hydroxybenzoate polyprenyltransferase